MLTLGKGQHSSQPLTVQWPLLQTRLLSCEVEALQVAASEQCSDDLKLGSHSREDSKSLSHYGAARVQT